jgi:hypothetical protein
MKPGIAKKLDEHYRRGETCTLLMACEPTIDLCLFRKA